MENSENKASPKRKPVINGKSRCSYKDDLEESIPIHTMSPNVAADNLIQYKATEDHDNKGDAYHISACQKWGGENEYGEYRDDRGVKVELELVQRNEFVNYFASQYTVDARIQYPAGDAAVFRPPLSSSLQYNYNYGHQSSQIASPRQKHLIITPAMAPPDHNPHLGQATATPNMWCPNTQYNGSSSFYSAAYDQKRFPPYNGSGCTNDHLADVHHLSNSGREARNRAEKNRRDKLNGSIHELSTMVPHVAESPRRVDKTAILRFAAHGLRLEYVFRDTLNFARPQLTDALMKLLDSFFITLTCHGQIILISSSIEQHLGHCQTDLYGQNILNITHPEDHDLIRQQLLPTDLENLIDIQPDNDSGEREFKVQSDEDSIDKKLRDDKRSFTVRLARAGPRSEPPSYEVVKLDGCFRRSDSAPCGWYNPTPSGLQLIKRMQRRDEAIPLHSISGNDIVLIAIARVVRPPKLIRKMMEANTLEYKTRHLIDGRIIDCDQRIGIVAGYMTDEVRNLSPFTFMHQDDVRWVIVALRQMYDCDSSYGESTYRLLTRNGCFIYLQSKGYLEIDKETNTVHSFVCVNTLLEEEEGKRRLQEMKDKFSIIINKQIPASAVDVPASENPQQIVKAVLCLIQSLQKTSSDDEEVASSSIAQLNDLKDPPFPQRPVSSSSSSLSSKTPPLALVPPEPSSIENSISKSVSVVNVTARKHLHVKRQQPPTNESPTSPLRNDGNHHDDGNGDDDDFLSEDFTEAFCGSCQYQIDGIKCEDCGKTKREVSKLKRRISPSETEEDLNLLRKRFKNNEIQNVILSSLDKVGRSLQEQQNAAIGLEDHSNMYEVPNAKTRIKAIMEECQKQNEMYVNITTEIQSQGIDANTMDTSTTDAPAVVELKPR